MANSETVTTESRTEGEPNVGRPRGFSGQRLSSGTTLQGHPMGQESGEKTGAVGDEPANRQKRITEELVTQYESELETNLIFAGLLAGVTTAFTLYIQPRIETPGYTTGDLVAYILLCLSLVATFAAMLLSIIARQLSNRRGLDRANMSPAEQERNAENGMGWIGGTLHAMVLLLSILLQFGLLFLAVGVIAYLWGVNRTVAIVLLALSAPIVPTILTFLILSLTNVGLAYFRNKSGTNTDDKTGTGGPA